MSEPLRALPGGQYVALAGRQPGLSSVALSVSQSPTSNARWRLQLFAQLPQANVLLGEMVTSAPQAGARPTRVVAIGWCPGAESWNIIATLDSGTPSNVESVELTAGTCCAGEPFVVLDGIAAGNGAWRYWTQSLTGPGALAIPAPFFPVGVSVWTTGPGATLQVASGPAILLPDSGSLSLAPPIIDGHPTQLGGVNVTTVGAVGASVVESVFRA